MKLLYWYAKGTGMTVTSGVPLNDDAANSACIFGNKNFPELYHWTVRYFPAV